MSLSHQEFATSLNKELDNEDDCYGFIDIIRTNSENDLFKMKDPICIIGRGHQCHIIIKKSVISTKHAIIKVSSDGTKATVQNFGENGLYLNNSFISKLDPSSGTPTTPVPLKTGDVISIVGSFPVSSNVSCLPLPSSNDVEVLPVQINLSPKTPKKSLLEATFSPLKNIITPKRVSFRTDTELVRDSITSGYSSSPQLLSANSTITIDHVLNKNLHEHIPLIAHEPSTKHGSLIDFELDPNNTSKLPDTDISPGIDLVEPGNGTIIKNSINSPHQYIQAITNTFCTTEPYSIEGAPMITESNINSIKDISRKPQAPDEHNFNPHNMNTRETQTSVKRNGLNSKETNLSLDKNDICAIGNNILQENYKSNTIENNANFQGNEAKLEDDNNFQKSSSFSLDNSNFIPPLISTSFGTIFSGVLSTTSLSETNEPSIIYSNSTFLIENDLSPRHKNLSSEYDNIDTDLSNSQSVLKEDEYTTLHSNESQIQQEQPGIDSLKLFDPNHVKNMAANGTVSGDGIIQESVYDASSQQAFKVVVDPYSTENDIRKIEAKSDTEAMLFSPRRSSRLVKRSAHKPTMSSPIVFKSNIKFKDNIFMDESAITDKSISPSFSLKRNRHSKKYERELDKENTTTNHQSFTNDFAKKLTNDHNTEQAAIMDGCDVTQIFTDDHDTEQESSQLDDIEQDGHFMPYGNKEKSFQIMSEPDILIENIYSTPISSGTLYKKSEKSTPRSAVYTRRSSRLADKSVKRIKF